MYKTSEDKQIEQVITKEKPTPTKDRKSETKAQSTSSKEPEPKKPKKITEERRKRDYSERTTKKETEIIDLDITP